MKTLFLSLLIFTLILSSSAWIWPWQEYPDLKTAQNFNLANYTGHWYEIARLPFKKESDCVCAQQNLTFSDHMIMVNNTCHRDSPKGELEIALYKMWPKDKDVSSKLNVQHIWPFKGDYYVIDVAEDYSWALVGEPNREHLWIMSRRPKISIGVNNKLVIEAYELHFPVEKLIYTEQNCGNNYQ